MSQLLKMFSIRDAKAEVFNPPFFSRTHGEAERSFDQLVMDPKSTVSQYPEDYDLYYLGDYDDLNGKFSPEPTPKHVRKAIEVQKRL